MSWIVNTSTVTGQMSGQVMRRNCVQRPAPSSADGLVDLARDVAQAGDEQQDVEADQPPDRDEGDRRHEQRHRAEHRDLLRRPVNGAMTYCATPKSLSNIQLQMRIDDRDRQDVGQEERGEHDALQPALEPVDAERDGKPERACSGRRRAPRNRWCSRPRSRTAGPRRGARNSRSRPTSPAPISGALVKLSCEHLDGRIDEHHAVDDDERRHQAWRRRVSLRLLLTIARAPPRSPTSAPAGR